MSDITMAPYTPNARCGIWIVCGPEWADWDLNRIVARDGALALDSTVDSTPVSDPTGTAGDLTHPEAPASSMPPALTVHGVATGPECDTPLGFTSLVASWNAETAPGTQIVISARAKMSDHWTGWFVMGRWSGPGTGSSVERQFSPDGEVKVDTLDLHRPAYACQFRAELWGRAGASVRVTLASLCWYNPAVECPPPPAVEGSWARVLRVPCRSQRLQDRNISDSACSPTSLSMILGFYGIDRRPADVAAGVHDEAADIFGNWPMNTAYSAACGCPAYVGRFWCLEQLQAEIAAGRPVEVSIRFGKGELDGAPLRYSRGHLVVVIGFASSGDVVVNDPAAPTESSVQRVYSRQQFEKAWIGGSGGIAYIVLPRPPEGLGRPRTGHSNIRKDLE